MRRTDISTENAVGGIATAATGERRAVKYPTRIRRFPCHILSAAKKAAGA